MELTRARVASLLGVPVARIHSLERIGVCRPAVGRTYGDTRPAVYDALEVAMLAVVLRAEGFGIKGQGLQELASALRRRVHLLDEQWVGTVVWDPAGGVVDLVHREDPLPRSLHVPRTALLLLPLDVPAVGAAAKADP